MHIIRKVLTVCLLFSGANAWAQQSVAVQAEIYSIFLRDKFGQDIQLLSGKSNYELNRGVLLKRGGARVNKSTPVLWVVPPTKNHRSFLKRYSLAQRINDYRFTSKDTAQVPEGLAGPYFPIPAGTRIKYPGWETKEYIHYTPALLLLGQKFDSLQHTTSVLSGPITIPGCQVKAESAGFLEALKSGTFFNSSKYSLGIVVLSEIAFSADGRYAVFYMHNALHRSCISTDSGFVFLEYSAEGWKLKLVSSYL